MPLVPYFHGPLTLLFVLFVVPAIWVGLRLRKRPRAAAPKVVFGAMAIMNTIYHVQALRSVGVDAISVVWGQTAYDWITGGQGFDVNLNVHIPSQRKRSRRWYYRLFHVYVTFARLLWERDVFFYYFQASSLYLARGGRLKWLELPILKFLGKKTVVMPYGADIVTAKDIKDLVRKYANVRQYPRTATNEREILRQLRYFGRWADTVMAGGAIGPGHLPRIDYLCASHFAINEEEWPPQYGPPRAVGEPFRVLHTPNHRHIKGTQFLISAIEQLKAEGLMIDLTLLEHIPNAEVKRVMAECHVLAEQFIQGWHGLNGLEGMASGKPVLCYLRPELKRLYSLYSFGRECPIVNTPVEDIAANLRWLYFHPEECERIGRQSRLYVERYHSLVAMGGYMAGIARYLYDSTPFEADAYWSQRAASQEPVPAAQA
ncbi:MAG: hypothetical protein HY680_01655 [Chloroflexi bacterium]|nr:hypothetical protein [Chloroflexota bacterium]